MKNLISAFGFLLISAVGICQVVNISDPEFKIVLVNDPSINTNGDNEIQVAEAAAFSGTINVSNHNVYHLSGIEAFTALTGVDCHSTLMSSLNLSSNTALAFLDCSQSHLTSIDVSANTALTYLDCSYNQLTSLNISANTFLEYINCSTNQLTGLDVSANAYLRQLHCQYNQFISLDVSANALVALECQFNQLNSLDLSNSPLLFILLCFANQLESLNVQNGNNTYINKFSASLNPKLTCIQVDSVEWAILHWTDDIDATANFSEEICNVGITEETNYTFTIFPNPATTHLTLTTPTTAQTNYTLYDLSGRALRTGSFMQNTTITINDFAAGAYIVELVSEEGSSRQKFIKQ